MCSLRQIKSTGKHMNQTKKYKKHNLKSCKMTWFQTCHRGLSPSSTSIAYWPLKSSMFRSQLSYSYRMKDQYRIISRLATASLLNGAVFAVPDMTFISIHQMFFLCYTSYQKQSEKITCLASPTSCLKARTRAVTLETY